MFGECDDHKSCEHAFVTSQWSLRHQFQHALERGSALDAISAARAMGGLSLGDALALCVVLAERSPAHTNALPAGGSLASSRRCRTPRSRRSSS
jgi:hypothetical protein